MDLVNLLVMVGVAVIVICVVWRLLSQVPLDPMMRKVITIAAVVIVAILCIYFLLSLTGRGSMRVGELMFESRAILLC